MPDLGYDLTALETFSGQLGTVRKGLEESHSTIGSYDSDYGHGGVRDAMHHFEKHWRDGRKHVEHTAKSLESMVTEAVKAYTKVDEDLAKQLTAGTRTQGAR